MYVPYTYHGLYDRYHKNNVGSGELRRLSLDKLVDAHARSKGMITFEVFVCLLVFLSALVRAAAGTFGSVADVRSRAPASTFRSMAHH